MRFLWLAVVVGCGPGVPTRPDGGTKPIGYFCKDETVQTVCRELCLEMGSDGSLGRLKCAAHGGALGQVEWERQGPTWADWCAETPSC